MSVVNISFLIPGGNINKQFLNLIVEKDIWLILIVTNLLLLIAAENDSSCKWFQPLFAINFFWNCPIKKLTDCNTDFIEIVP